MRDGIGYMKFSNGGVYNGMWKDDMKNGFGMGNFPTSHYNG